MNGLARLCVVMTAGLALSACAPNLEQAKGMMEALAQDEASACMAVWVGVGGGALIPAPAAPAVGGWGYLFAGRTNQPGAKVWVDNASCMIEHGPAEPLPSPVAPAVRP